MTKLYLEGFSEVECAAIDRFFEARQNKPPGWQRVADWAVADVLLINARERDPIDQRAEQLSPWQDIVIIGSSDFGTGWPSVARPIKLTAVLEAINQVLQLKSGFEGPEYDSSVSALEETRAGPLTRPTRHTPLTATPLGLRTKPVRRM